MELALMNKLASSPWEMNVVHVCWFLPLKVGPAFFAQNMIVKLCPEATSLSSMIVEEQEMVYMLVARAQYLRPHARARNGASP